MNIIEEFDSGCIFYQNISILLYFYVSTYLCRYCIVYTFMICPYIVESNWTIVDKKQNI